MDYPFLPTTTEELAKLFAERTQEAVTGLLGEDDASHFPAWVKKMARSFAEQVFTSKFSKAIHDKDTEFLLGAFGGMLLALTHFAKTARADQLLLGAKITEAQLASHPNSISDDTAKAIASGKPLESHEIHKLLPGILSDLTNQPPEKRARFLEGVIEGSDIEHAITTGGHRIGMAFDIQVVMLMFWPHLEVMNSRGEAVRFLKYCFRDRPAIFGDDDRVLGLLKRYGFKARE